MPKTWVTRVKGSMLSAMWTTEQRPTCKEPCPPVGLRDGFGSTSTCHSHASKAAAAEGVSSLTTTSTSSVKYSVNHKLVPLVLSDVCRVLGGPGKLHTTPSRGCPVTARTHWPYADPAVRNSIGTSLVIIIIAEGSKVKLTP